MTDPRSDLIAREAARLIETGRTESIGQAIRAAADALGMSNVDPPGHGRVRQHTQAMSMQALGEAGYAESVRRVWRVAERMMTVLAESTEQVEPVLVGRLVRGQIDGGVTAHIRLYTRVAMPKLARALVEYGYDEPSFETAATRLGRLSRMRLEDEGIELALTRLLPEMAVRARQDLFTGRPVETATLAELRRKLEG